MFQLSEHPDLDSLLPFAFMAWVASPAAQNKPLERRVAPTWVMVRGRLAAMSRNMCEMTPWQPSTQGFTFSTIIYGHGSIVSKSSQQKEERNPILGGFSCQSPLKPTNFRRGPTPSRRLGAGYRPPPHCAWPSPPGAAPELRPTPCPPGPAGARELLLGDQGDLGHSQSQLGKRGNTTWDLGHRNTSCWGVLGVIPCNRNCSAAFAACDVQENKPLVAACFTLTALNCIVALGPSVLQPPASACRGGRSG